MVFVLYLCSLAFIYSFIHRFWLSLALTVLLWSALTAVFTALAVVFALLI
jgi:hypothetical protein